MTFPIYCENVNCGKELDKPGALVFSPPLYDGLDRMTAQNIVSKMHLCRECWVEHIFIPLRFKPNELGKIDNDNNNDKEVFDEQTKKLNRLTS